MSPTPGRSTLITSAPNHASSCVQVGPDWTWVKSRMRRPSSALVLVLLRTLCLPLHPAGNKGLRGGRSALGASALLLGHDPFRKTAARLSGSAPYFFFCRTLC